MGTPEPGANGTTVAVNVIGWPKTVGDPDVVTLETVLDLLTKRVMVGEVLVL